MTDELGKKELEFEDAKAQRLIAKHRLDAARGRLHMTLVARREAGENLTIADMKAILAKAIDDDELVKDAYLKFIAADSAYRAAKIAYDCEVRLYWDGKGK